MTPRRSDAADRILREATRLFAEKGYERTSVPEIQAAAGLTRGSGAMYKHYPSKEALLAAVIGGFLDQAGQERATLGDLALPPGETLCWIARAVVDTLDRRRAELRIIWRDLQQFPSLQATVRSQIMQSSYRAIAAWLRAQAHQGHIREHDSEAVAAVIHGGLVMFKVFEAVWGEKTLPVDDERFKRAWCDLVGRGLGLDEGNTPQPTVSRKPANRKSRQAAKSKRAIARGRRERDATKRRRNPSPQS
jgi:AcrR family transcriptional regulator